MLVTTIVQNHTQTDSWPCVGRRAMERRLERRASRKLVAVGTGPHLEPQGRPNRVVRKLNMAVDRDKIVRADERAREKGLSLRGLVIGALAVLVIGLVAGGWAMTRLQIGRAHV